MFVFDKSCFAHPLSYHRLITQYLHHTDSLIGNAWKYNRTLIYSVRFTFYPQPENKHHIIQEKNVMRMQVFSRMTIHFYLMIGIVLHK